MKVKALMIIAVAALVAVYAVPGFILQLEAQSTGSIKSKSIEARLRTLEDREEIRQLMIDYGRTLDQRDFAGFSKLFAQDAEYGGGGGTGMTKGAEAIAKLLEDVFQKNPTNLNTPNFHLFCNEIIKVDGDKASALSKGVFVVRGNNNMPESVMLATYKDVFVRENGVWKFKQRIVQGDIPSAQSSRQQ
jgi:uncharacterized protein (TIGR02246 family)